MKIEIRDNTAYVFTPYNPAFVKEIKTIGGAKWDGVQRCWKVPEATVDTVRKIMMEVYGETDLPDGGEKVTVRVKFNEMETSLRSSIVVFGKTIACAFGRDSGARVGDEAAFIVGAPRSGGSAKNWTTVIDEGSVVEIRNVPIAALNDSYEYEIVEEKKIDRSALEEEKAKLLKRLAEIEALLA